MKRVVGWILLISGLPGNASADIFKCQEHSGIITLQSMPCPEYTTPLTELPPVADDVQPAAVDRLEKLQFAPEQRIDQLSEALNAELPPPQTGIADTKPSTAAARQTKSSGKKSHFRQRAKKSAAVRRIRSSSRQQP